MEKNRWYSFTGKAVLDAVESNDETGLSRKEAEARLKTDGKNIIHPLQKASIRGYLLQVTTDLTAILMLALALLAVIYRHDAGAFVMLALLLGNYAVCILSYINAQKALEKMGSESKPTAKVLRDGKLKVIDGEAVVQGDIIHLAAGDIVPCDARILSSDGLKALEGNLFGLSKPSVKDGNFEYVGALRPEDAQNMLYASTVILSGRCVAAAVETGPDTLVCRMGKNKPIAACHKLDVVRSLKRISSVIGVVLLVPAFVLTLIALIRGEGLIETALCSLALAVSAMPEMYAAFAYLTVSFGIRGALEEKKKKRLGAFIKNPLALPALRDVDTLLLPIENFVLESSSVLSGIFDCDNAIDLSTGIPEESALRVLRYGVISTGLYSADRLITLNQKGENIYTKEQEALIASAERLGIYNKSLEETYPILDHRAAGELGSLFETTLVSFRDQDVVVLRGEPSQVLPRCSGYCRHGRVREMDESDRTEFLSMAQTLRRERHIAVAVATKNSVYNSLQRIADCQQDLIFEGFLLIEKPLLPDAAKQILKLREAGVQVLAYSRGDAEEYRYLANALGIAHTPDEIVSSGELTHMSEEIFRINMKNYKYFEGLSPSQLRYAVEVLGGEYKRKVGMLGEKIVDVYAMYASNTGFSEQSGRQLGRVSRRGEELRAPVYSKKSGASKDAGCQALNYISDVILPETDPSGRGGVNAAALGISAARWIYRNIGVLLFYLTFTLGLRLTMLICGPASLLSPVQMRFSGLALDLAAVFVIALDRPEGSFAARWAFKTPLSLAARLLPFLITGAGCAVLTAVSAHLLPRFSLMPGDGVTSYCFFVTYLMQIAALSALLRIGRKPGKELKMSAAYRIFLASSAAFLLLCFLIKPVGETFSLRPFGWIPLGIGAGIVLLLTLIAFTVGYILRRTKEKNRNKKNKKRKE